MQKIFPRTRVITRRVHRMLKIRRRRKWLLRMAVQLTFLLVSLHHHISIVFLHQHHHHRHHISTISSPPLPPPPHFYCFLSFAHSFHFFSPRYFIKDCQLLSFVHFVAMSRVANNNRGFLQLLAVRKGKRLPKCGKYFRERERIHRILKIRRRRKWLLRMAVNLKAPKIATTTLKTTVKKQKVVVLKRPPLFTLKVPVNIVRTFMCREHWLWNVQNVFGTITTRFVLYAITRSSRREITTKRAFFGVTIAEQLHTKTRRRWKPISVPLLKRRTKKRVN